jgi:hypothetical protein
MQGAGPMPPFGAFFPGLIFVGIWLLMMGGMLVGYIILLIAVWRAMKAHESISETLKEIAAAYRAKP